MGDLRHDPRRVSILVAHVIARQGDDRCYRCGRPGARSLEHVIPVTFGGSDDLTNLAVSHLACNRAAGASLGERPRPRPALPPARLAVPPTVAGPSDG